jgi:hypothetical protein
MNSIFAAAESPYCSWDDISDNSMSTISFTVPYLWAAAGDYLTMITAGRATMCNTDVWTRMWKHVRISKWEYRILIIPRG